jgi:hypothetical protein
MRLAFLVVFGLAFLAGCGGSSSSDDVVGGSGSPTSSSPSSVPDSEHCEPPPVEPTYLPWIARGEAIPEPEVSKGPDDATTLKWVRPDSPDPSYVLLRRTSIRTGGGLGDEVPVSIPDVQSAQFYEGEVAGMAFLVWDTGELSCGEIGLQLVATDMTRAQARDEILKVAKSLTG